MPRSPLHEAHEALGARFVDFSGWDMPVQYEGVISEHKAVRTGAGVFDVSHLGRFSVAGEGSTDLLRRLLCNDASAIPAGKAQYTMALNDRGGVTDDIIIWRLGDEDFWVLPNGANHDGIVSSFRAGAPGSVAIENLQTATALLAVQGPESIAVLESVVGNAPKRFRVMEAAFDGQPVHMAGTGYTGERGAEIAIAAHHAGPLLQALLDAGATPCGLGARDTLRLEMGYPLWGQDLDPDTTPLEAGLGWVVDWDHEFTGKEALARQRDGGTGKALTSFVMEGRQIPRHEYPMRAGGATGTVTSGNYSPMLEVGIGMGYLTPASGAVEAQVEVEIRDRWVPARRVELPFLKG
jgi:aminomethyltransferase